MKGTGPDNSDTSHSSLFIPDSPTNSKKALFVNPKVKPSKGKDVGLEFAKDVMSDNDYYKKIFETDCYKTTNEALIDYYEDMSRLLASAQAKDSRNMGAILGMTILGAVGFFAFSWTIVGGIIGGAVGIALGRYAGKKLRKRIKHKGPIIEEELYTIKMKCLLKLAKIHGADLKYNLNRYRFILEKTIEENVLSLDFTLFKEPKKIHKELLRLKEILFTVIAQKAILLSYKLFKLFLQQIDINNPKSREEVSLKLNGLFVPYIKIMELHKKYDKKSDKINKKISKLATYVKIQKLLRNPEIVKILIEYPDLRQDQDFKKKFKEMLSTPVDLQQRFTEARNENDKIAQEIANNGDTSVLEPNDEMDNISEDISEERTGELKTKIYKYDFDEIVSQKAHSPFIHTTASKQSLSENTHKNDVSKESSESSDDEKNKRITHKENVMNDPALFYDKEKAKIPDLPVGDPNKESSTPLPTPKTKKQISRVCEDLDTNFDPNRTTHKYEVMRMNSAHSMSVKDDEPEEKKEDAPQPRKSIMNEISSEKQKQATKRELVFQKVLSLAYDKTMNWDVVTKQENLIIDKVRPEGSPVVLIRAWATLKDCSPFEINSQIYDTENRQKWDTVTNNIRVIDTLEDGSEIIHFVIKAPFGVANRDFVQKRNLALDYPVKGQVVISFMSTTHPAIPPIKGNVRGETHIAGYVFKPNAVDPKSTDFCILSQVDIKGAIPKFVVNYVAGKAPAEWLEKLKKAVERHRDGGDPKDKKKKK